MKRNIQQDMWKHMAGVEAVKLIEDGMVLGIGTGTTAAQMIYALAQRIREGLRIRGVVPTSQASAELARARRAADWERGPRSPSAAISSIPRAPLRSKRMYPPPETRK